MRFPLSSIVPVLGTQFSEAVAVKRQQLPKKRCLIFRQLVENRAELLRCRPILIIIRFRKMSPADQISTDTFDFFRG